AERAAGVRFEARGGGRVVELTTEGTEHTWAEVIAWDPPHRFVMAWHPNPDPVAASIVEVGFEPTAGGCRLRLEHRAWEEFGPTVGTEARNQYDPGWDGVLGLYLDAAS
ncbi:MAG: SRPBCC domain-containing protein, partial [Acidimicrobiales bacterium]